MSHHYARLDTIFLKLCDLLFRQHLFTSLIAVSFGDNTAQWGLSNGEEAKWFCISIGNANVDPLIQSLLRKTSVDHQRHSQSVQRRKGLGDGDLLDGGTTIIPIIITVAIE